MDRNPYESLEIDWTCAYKGDCPNDFKCVTIPDGKVRMRRCRYLQVGFEE